MQTLFIVVQCKPAYVHSPRFTYWVALRSISLTVDKTVQ